MRGAGDGCARPSRRRSREWLEPRRSCKPGLCLALTAVASSSNVNFGRVDPVDVNFVEGNMATMTPEQLEALVPGVGLTIGNAQSLRTQAAEMGNVLAQQLKNEEMNSKSHDSTYNRYTMRLLIHLTHQG